jgi:hypothetical protein
MLLVTQLKESFNAWTTTVENGSVGVGEGEAVTVGGTSVAVVVGRGVAVGVSAGMTTGGNVGLGDAGFAAAQPTSTAKRLMATRRRVGNILVPAIGFPLLTFLTSFLFSIGSFLVLGVLSILHQD